MEYKCMTSMLRITIVIKFLEDGFSAIKNRPTRIKFITQHLIPITTDSIVIFLIITIMCGCNVSEMILHRI